MRVQLGDETAGKDMRQRGLHVGTIIIPAAAACMSILE